MVLVKWGDLNENFNDVQGTRAGFVAANVKSQALRPSERQWPCHYTS